MGFGSFYKQLIYLLLFPFLCACYYSSDDTPTVIEEIIYFPVGGTIFALNGEITLQLKNTTLDNGTLDTATLILNDVAAFDWSFLENMPDGDAFEVIISEQPSGQVCNISNDSGTINGAEVTNVVISCTTTGEPLTGVLLDSPVSGLSYTTESQSGITDSNGSYLFFPGEQVQFSLGELKLPLVNANTQVTPLDMLSEMTNRQDALSNIIRLLITLDQDADPSNGIEISSQAEQFATPINFEVPSAEFELDPSVLTLIQNAGQIPAVSTLISAQNASTHFSQSLLDKALVFEPQLFIDQIFYDVYLQLGTWNKFEFTFHQDGQFSGLNEGTNETKSGLYSFELFNRVIVLDIVNGDDEGEDHNEYIVLKEFIPEQQIYRYCWIDNAEVIDSVHAHQLCTHGIRSGNNTLDLLPGMLVFESAQADTIIANDGEMF